MMKPLLTFLALAGIFLGKAFGFFGTTECRSNAHRRSGTLDANCFGSTDLVTPNMD